MTTHLSYFFIFILTLSNVIQAESEQSGIAQFDGQELIDSLKVMSFSNPNDAVDFAFEILKLYPSIRPNKSIANVFSILGEIYQAKGLSLQALEYYTEAERENVESGGLQEFPWLKVNMGNVYFSEGLIEKSRSKYLEAYKIFSNYEDSINKNNNLAGQAVCQNNLGMIEQGLNNFTNALLHFNQGLAVRYTMDRPLDLVHSYLNIGQLYLEWGKTDSAIHYFDRADSITHSYNAQDHNYKQNHEWGKKINPELSRRYAGKGQVFRANLRLRLGQPAEAFVYYKRSIEYYQAWPRDYIHVLGLTADLFLTLNKPDSTIKYLEQGLLRASEKGLLGQELNLLQKKREVLSMIGDYKSSNTTAEKIITLKEQQISGQMDDMLYNLELKKDLMAKRREVKLEQAHSQKNMLISIFGFSVLILISLNFYSRHIASQQEKKIANQEKWVAERDRYIAEQESLMTRSELDSKEKELSSMSAYILQKNDLLYTLKKEVDYHVNLLPKDEQKIFRSLRSQLNSSIEADTDWEEFEKKFTTVYPGLLKTLASSYPQLTSSDLKLCTYLHMNQNTKEMAQLTGLSVRALESRRYRLRKKLQLDSGTDLVTFLHTIR